MKRAYNHILFDHRLLKDETLLYQIASNAFMEGDCFSQTIRAQGDEIWLWDNHFEHITKALKLLNGTWGDKDPKSQLNSDLHRLIRSNRAFTHTYIELVFFRNTCNDKSKSSILVQSQFSTWGRIFPAYNSWNANLDGIVLDIFIRQRKMLSSLSCLTTSSSYWPRQQALLFVQKMKLDDCILLNQEGDFCETIYSNLFIVRGMKVWTPAIETGCRIDVTRELVIRLLKNRGVEVIQAHFSHRELLLEAEEVFLTDIMHGIRSVAIFQTSRYIKRMATELINTIQTLNLSRP